MSENRRRELGHNDGAIEQELEESFDATVEKGAERLHRAFRHIALTGLFGGLDIGLGVMAYLAVLHETDNHLLAGLAFSVGLVALLLGHSELFTENFLVPVAAVVARQGTLLQLAKLWGVTLVTNLVGGWLIMWIITTAFPKWDATLADAAHLYVDTPISLPGIALALLGGSTITLMTGMQQGTTSDMAKIVATVIAGFLLAGLGLFHSILDSLLIFGAIQAGADINYLQWLGWFGYTLLFNILGGLVLVTALRLVRTKELVADRRVSPNE